MYFFKILRRYQSAFAGIWKGASISATGGTMTLKRFTFAGIVAMSFLLPSFTMSATYTLNVSLSTSAVNPSSLQQELLATLTTGQYLGRATPSPFFANTYSLTINGKNPLYQPGAVSVSTTIATMDGLLKRLEATTTDYFLYGYQSGVAYERDTDLQIIGGYGVRCSTSSFFVRQSTVPAWNPGVCMDSLNNAGTAIYQQNLSTPIIVPGF